MSGVCRSVCRSMIEYETPKVVTIHNPTIGLIRRCLQLCVVMYVCLYQLWYAQGYQEFAGVESSVTTKVYTYGGAISSDWYQAQIRIIKC